MKQLLLTLGLFIFSICSFAQNEDNDTIESLPIDKSTYVGKIVNKKFYRLPSFEQRLVFGSHVITLTPVIYKVNIDDNVVFYLSLEYINGSEKPRYAIIKYDDLIELKKVFEVLIDQGKSVTTTGDASFIQGSYTTSTDVEVGYNVRSYYKNKKKGEVDYVKKWYISHTDYKRFTYDFESYEDLYKLFCDALAKIESLR